MVIECAAEQTAAHVDNGKTKGRGPARGLGRLLPPLAVRPSLWGVGGSGTLACTPSLFLSPPSPVLLLCLRGLGGRGPFLSQVFRRAARGAVLPTQ